ncbi:DNA-binding response regulator [Clostridium sp. AM29-11AC]|uniref:response regulator transcription factor n=1 Tax=Clostridium sp. AM29-11AC TaxID=2293028 RepID=UPI000E52BE74|nr:response regulator transcription factor [Clostridium sp. AM29-11AC]RHT56495.1 DNA-binding response regulator [Clostridium sp. AM29-11AC]
MRILFAEDEPALREVTVKRLKAEGFGVDGCRDGKEALDYLDSTDYDVVILDIMMPGIDGLTVLRTLRSRGNTAPVMLLTARDAVADRVGGLDAGADDYLTKPFEFAELTARIRALLRRNSDNKTDTASVADLTVEFSTRKVTRGGVEISLSSREFALLESLIRHKGAILSRTQLENQVWDFGFEGGSNIVDVYIRYLRKKIDDPFEKKLIHTVRGAGYTLREE